MNKRQRNKRKKRQEARLAGHLSGPGAMRRLGEIAAAFIRAQLRRPSALSPRSARLLGRWRDGSGIVHVVNALSLGFQNDIDLGRETACEAVFWNPDEPWSYPGLAEDETDCMACVAHGCTG